jgi:hypothetical protein
VGEAPDDGFGLLGDFVEMLDAMPSPGSPRPGRHRQEGQTAGSALPDVAAGREDEARRGGALSRAFVEPVTVKVK